jgi:fibronectin-binding autotransporter adhesin
MAECSLSTRFRLFTLHASWFFQFTFHISQLIIHNSPFTDLHGATVMKTQNEHNGVNGARAGSVTVGRSEGTNTTQSSKRSTAMKTTLRIARSVFAVLLLASASLLGQNITNTGSGSITNSGTIKLTGAFTPATQVSIGGTMEYNNAGTQNIAGLQYANLTASGGTGDKTLVATTTVTGSFTVNNGTNNVVLNGQTIHVSGATPFAITAGSFDLSSGTVDYNGTGAQDLLGTTYEILTASGGASADKTADGNVTVTGTSPSLTNASSTVIDFGSHTFTGTGATISNSGLFKTGGTGAAFAVTSGASVGSVEYTASSGSVTVADASYANLNLSGGGTATYNLNNPSVSGTYSVSGTRAYGTGNFTYNGGAGQAITGDSYNALTLSNGGKTVAGAVSVATTLSNSVQMDINTGGSLALGSGAASFAALNLNNAGTSVSGGGGLVTFNGAVSTVASSSITSGAGGLAFASGSSLSNAGTLTVGNTQQMTVSTANSFANSGAGSFSLNAGSTVLYNLAGAQSVVPADYGTLLLQGGNTKSLSGTTGIQTALTTSGTTSVTISGGTTTLATNATATFDGDVTTTGTLDASTNTGTLVTFSGAGQTISGTDIAFRGLTLSGSAAKTSNVNLTVNGAFTPTYGISMVATKSLTIGASGSVGTYGSGQEVVGLMTVDAASAATYAMNNAFTSVSFTGADASRTFTLDNQPATNPTGSYDGAVQVDRKVTASYSNWATGTATLQLAYKVAEAPSASEGNLRYWRNDNTVSTNKVGTGVAITRNTADPTFHYLSLASIEPTGGSGSSYSKINSGDVVVMGNNAAPFVTIAASGDFNTGSTWDEGTVPGASDNAVINNTGITLASGASNTINSLTVNASSDLTLANGTGTLTVSSGVTNNGSITVGTTRSLTVTGAFTNAGSLTNNGTVTVQ